MTKPVNQFETMAVEAANRLDKVRQAGEQLSLLPDEAGRTAVEAGSGKAGRPAGAKSKGSSQMRQWLADQGYRMPEQVLAHMAGLASTDGAMFQAMQEAEAVLAWAFDGAEEKKADGTTVPAAPSAGQRLAVFQQFYAIKLRAAEALLPYGTPKASADVTVNQQVNLIVPVAPADAGASARVVNPKMGARMAPPPMPGQTVENQALSEDETKDADE